MLPSTVLASAGAPSYSPFPLLALEPVAHCRHAPMFQHPEPCRRFPRIRSEDSCRQCGSLAHSRVVKGLHFCRAKEINQHFFAIRSVIVRRRKDGAELCLTNMKALATYCSHRAERLLLFGISYEIQSMHIYSHVYHFQARKWRDMLFATRCALCAIPPRAVCRASAG